MIWHSFIGGWGRAARLWPLVLLLYAVDTAFALVMTVPPASQLFAAFGYSAMAPQLVNVPSLDMLVELLSNTDLTGFPWLLYLLIPLVSMSVTTFLRGGVLEALARGENSISAAEFFAACVRLFPRLLIILLCLPAGFLAIGAVAAILGLLLGTLVGLLFGSAGVVVAAVIQPLGIVLLLAMADYSRVSLVLDPERSVFRHLGRGVRFVVLRIAVAGPLALAFWATTALIAALYPLLLGPWPILSGFWAAFIVQQLAALLASWQRVAMLGGEMHLFVHPRTPTSTT